MERLYSHNRSASQEPKSYLKQTHHWAISIYTYSKLNTSGCPMCCTASCDFIHSLHENGGTPSTVGPFTAHTPIFLLWSDVEVTLLSIAPKCLGLLVSRSYREAMTYVGSPQFAYVARISLSERIVQIVVRAQNLQEPVEILDERLDEREDRGTNRVTLEDVVSRAVVVVVLRRGGLGRVARSLVDLSDVGDIVGGPVSLSLISRNRSNCLAKRASDIFFDGQSGDLLHDPHQILGLLRSVEVHGHPLAGKPPAAKPGCCTFRCCRERRDPPRSSGRAPACCSPGFATGNPSIRPLR